MNLTANRTEFLAICRKLCKVATDSNAHPIFSGILFEADADNLEVRLTTTNVETTICYVVSAAVRESGSMVINANLFTNMLSLLGESVVKIHQPFKDRVVVSSGKASYEVGTLFGNDFPKIHEFIEERSYEITKFAGLVDSTEFAVSKNGDNIILKCIKLEISKDYTRMITTDSTRLMISQKGQRVERENVSESILILASSLKLLSSVINEDDIVTMSVGHSNNIVFKTNDMNFIARSIQGKFLNADDVVSNICVCCEAAVDADDFY